MSASTSLAAYLVLALVSHRKRQMLPRNKFLLLAAGSAIALGEVDLAERCRNIVLAANPQHMVSRWPSFSITWEVPEFQTYYRQLQRFCLPERAEHLAVCQGLGPLDVGPEQWQTWLEELEK